MPTNKQLVCQIVMSYNCGLHVSKVQHGQLGTLVKQVRQDDSHHKQETGS